MQLIQLQLVPLLLLQGSSDLRIAFGEFWPPGWDHLVDVSWLWSAMTIHWATFLK